MYEYLDRRYALALYEVIRHPQINTRRKKQTYIYIFKGKIDEELLSFLLILIEKDRILYLREKLNQMEKIDLERKNTLKGIIKTAIPLLDDEFNTLKDIFEKKYDKNIIFETKVDKKVLGGVYVRIGNDVIDDTVKSKIDEMKDLMLRKK